MTIHSVFDEAFRPYGRVVEGYDTAELLAAMEAIPMPASGTAYEPGIASLESCAVFADFRDRAYGGMPVQLGMCWGYNTRLNCLEYHRDSEWNLGTEDFILLLALQSEMEGETLDTGRVRAFRVPKGVLVEVYATSLHYAPCHCSAEKGFRTAVLLPLGTNTEKPAMAVKNGDDALLRARNKWLLAHGESPEAADGAFVGLRGINIDIENLIG